MKDPCGVPLIPRIRGACESSRLSGSLNPIEPFFWAVLMVEKSNAARGYSMTTATVHRYVVTDDQTLGGESIIQGTRTPVRAIVEVYRLGVSAEEIPNRLPHLTVARVFDALSYYNDHAQEINAYIERNRVADDKLDPLVKS